MDYEHVAQQILNGNVDFLFSICENENLSYELLYLVLYGLCNDKTGITNPYLNIMTHFFTKKDIMFMRSGLYNIENLFKIVGLYSPENLSQAARFNNIKLVQYFFTQLDIPQKEIKNAFCNACTGGYLELVEYLFNKLEDFEFEDYPLHLAIDNDRSEVVQFLLLNGFEEMYKKQDLITALHFACTNQQKLEIVKMLKLHNERDAFGFTPLHRAVISNQMDVVKILCENINDINVIDKEGKTPLFYACAHSHKSVMKILLNNQAKL